MKATRSLTSTFNNVLPSSGTLIQQSLSKAHREPLRGVARGVLVAIGISLLLPYEAGSSNMSDIKLTPKQYAYHSLGDIKQYKCIASLYGKESAWNPKAVNGSHAGIPQGRSKWLLTATPIQQVEWGLRYIEHRYSTPCNAWAHWKAKGWH